MYVSRGATYETIKPILKGDHPEFDDSDFVSEEDKAKYLSMINTTQCLVHLQDLITLLPCLHYPYIE